MAFSLLCSLCCLRFELPRTAHRSVRDFALAPTGQIATIPPQLQVGRHGDWLTCPAVLRDDRVIQPSPRRFSCSIPPQR
jgi:hypothetical protein